MLAARLHGPKDIRIEEIPHPGHPRAGEALVRVNAVGVCGSDLHIYADGRIGDTWLGGPATLGHEFCAIVEEVGEGAVDGEFRPLSSGVQVAVDPSQPCGHCPMCERGHPNLCHHLNFCGMPPCDGALCQYLRVPAHTCFPVAKEMDPGEVTLLETVGVAIHAVDLAKIRVGESLAILGAGPVGLCILQIARLAGAEPIFVSDKFEWRLELARKLGAITTLCEADPLATVMRETHGQGVDVAIEAAWADESVQQAAEMLRLGGRMVIVGISADDELKLRHSTVRRKGVTIRLARRMKHTYPRAIPIASRGAIDLASLISHRFPLKETAKAFEINHRYEPGVVKVVVMH